MPDTVLGSGNKMLTTVDGAPSLWPFLRQKLGRQLGYLARWSFHGSCEGWCKRNICRIHWNHKVCTHNLVKESLTFLLCESGDLWLPRPDKEHVNKNNSVACTLDELNSSKVNVSMEWGTIVSVDPFPFLVLNQWTHPNLSFLHPHCHQPYQSHHIAHLVWLYRAPNWTLCFCSCLPHSCQDELWKS